MALGRGGLGGRGEGRGGWEGRGMGWDVGMGLGLGWVKDGVGEEAGEMGGDLGEEGWGGEGFGGGREVCSCHGMAVVV